jgi:NADH dehydrogenase FAD-containing subunit
MAVRPQVVVLGGGFGGIDATRHLKHADVDGTLVDPHDKGTMATIGRGAAVAQTRGGHSLTGRTAFLAWGAVHLALLSTGEDRAKAVVDWTWSGVSHERPGRISVRPDRP